ncbi:MAG TPA: GNAT family N-acetyltransferase [Streptosporangiaceae bacterium]|nr:GNAT family N-acetyltransferase [Streptosporangiaceae bacterium]
MAGGTTGTLAELTPGDAGEVLTLQRAAFVTEARAHRDPELPPLTQTLAEIQAELGEPSCRGWALREAGRLVGSVRVHIGGDSAELVRLMVAPDRQGLGIGTRLLLAAEDLLPPGVRTIHLVTGQYSHANLRLYRRHGYQQTRTSPARGYQLIHFVKIRNAGPAPRPAERS